MASSQNNIPWSVFGFMEGLWDVKKVMKLTYYALFLDIWLIILTKHGVFYLSIENRPDLTFGSVIGIAISFAFISTFILDICYLLVVLPLIRAKYNRHWFKYRADYGNAERGYVRLSQLQDEALNNQCEFMHKRFSEVNDKLVVEKKELRQSKLIAVGLAILIAIEWYLSSPDGTTQSFVDWLWNMLRQRDEIITHWGVGFVCLICFVGYAIIICWPEEIDDMVYFPPLYNRNEELKEKRRKDERERENEIERILRDKNE
ncbi:hypothetical protein SJI19_23565 [Acerihabitans sp. TG2]|uniref:hypothetical protein n=1 Tax=Acerihabitans sp. TG2 TaxID=3096008 RepID=UPI002B23E034|nr:hypothetical protein [Acerihabitans sp. TG2]MEA9393473.1 hypothetical protein [Acerihabitans sp. TG2]